MELIISDSAQVEMSNRVKDILRALFIDDWQSEPKNQQQNFAERRYRDVKRKVKWILDSTGANPNEWLLVLQYVCYVMNHTALESLNWQTPLEVLTGITPDASIIYQMPYRTKVYFLKHEGGVSIRVRRRTRIFCRICGRLRARIHI